MLVSNNRELCQRRGLYKITYDNIVIGVAADDLFDLLSGSLSGGEGAVGVTVGVVQVQDIYSGVCPQARLTQHCGSISEVT